jgi:hypothetical protein
MSPSELYPSREGSMIAVAATVLALVAGFYAAKELMNEGQTKCSGQQKVEVNGGDTVYGIIDENIKVTDGYIDFSQVPVTVLRYRESQKPTEVENAGQIMPGDIAVLPTTCHEE